ncbi:Aspartate carbamoyltransferase [Frankliniella fusca]|uniref:Aspartate carbamoyltransferase n=1 Tax=Frankliniella fusca TaxID=407009 RepID=A0AAE1H362_9NEOP|nr:Aspartate carbamoyltransferase [Frankliniella fusca]
MASSVLVKSFFKFCMVDKNEARMAHNANAYKQFVGTVVEIINPYKALLEFQDLGSNQKALLRVDKLTCKPSINTDGSADHPITDFVSIGTSVKCFCHKLGETGDQKSFWFVAEVLSIGSSLTDSNMVVGICPPMLNRIGYVSHLDKRMGVISFKDKDNDIPQDVLFIASKFYDGGKRAKTKQPLDKILAVNDKVNFDAVPTDPEENDHNCSWFAPLVWKRSKPHTDYDSLVQDQDPNLAQIKTVIRNPKSQFIRGKGQIMHILNEDYGIALGAVNLKQTHWQSILFHRSCASIFKHSLSATDLRQVFKEGDKIRFIAAVAPKGFSAQWVASHISIDVVGEAKHLVENQL